MTGEAIRDGLRALGIAAGDSLILHCALSSIGHVVRRVPGEQRGGADALIDGVLAAVGPEGTVMMPVLPDIYVPFDVSRSPSTVGQVSEVFWRRPEARRSRHPSHSVAAIGARARELTEGHEHTLPTGPDSPYERLCRLGGWVLLLGVDQDRNTMLHLAETLAGVPYLRTGHLQVVGEDGAITDFVAPQMAYGHREFIGIDKALRERSLVRLERIGDATVRLMRADALVDFTVDLLHRDPAALLCAKPRCIFCHWARAQIEAARTGRPDETDWPAVTREWGCGDPHCECCVV
ncbi:MAG: AAC(3) family N-acetyltransferase [Anaerolineae bacterium]